eukprot:CAMPEP_0117794300 /NCGR_PEP_ID=MMETSP0948-20121206/10604_1 /TAXON_ID=44440 /ORGANISM="Chattonella subsalsa, Strain CCMP2191" /LENGTH=96 /DNA_ID=CAMNT_0005624985 /DNA_START=348 /DNA_END=638 /DNA_ORIENTATION=+
MNSESANQLKPSNPNTSDNVDPSKRNSRADSNTSTRIVSRMNVSSKKSRYYTSRQREQYDCFPRSTERLMIARTNSGYWIEDDDVLKSKVDIATEK